MKEIIFAVVGSFEMIVVAVYLFISHNPQTMTLPEEREWENSLTEIVAINADPKKVERFIEEVATQIKLAEERGRNTWAQGIGAIIEDYFENKKMMYGLVGVVGGDRTIRDHNDEVESEKNKLLSLLAASAPQLNTNRKEG